MERVGMPHKNEPVSKTYSGSVGFRYRACRPDEILIKSGMGVKTEVTGKKTFQWPFQRVTIISLAPRNYSFTLNCISKDMVPFELPVVFTIAPYDPLVDDDGFARYCLRMSAMTTSEIEEVVLGIIHGQTRLYAAGLTVIQMFADRDSFKCEVQERIHKELISFGLVIFNANISEMKDKPGNEYFESLKKKAISGAMNEARIATAEATKRGDIGEAERRAEAKIRLAQVAADLKSAENLRQQEIEKSALQLELVRLACKKDQETQRIAAVMAPKKKEAELQTELNKLDGVKHQEYLRSTKLSDAIVSAEGEVKIAEGRKTAQNALADSQLYAEQRKAEGILAKADAQSESLSKLLASGNSDMLKYFLALDKNLFSEMAQKTADAIKGLAPKINVWNTGGGEQQNNAEFSSLRNLFTSLPPMLDAVESQAGIKMPQWLPQQRERAPPA